MAPNKRIAASQSFSEAEVLLLDSLIKLILRGGDARQLVRSEAAASLMRKCASMKAAIEKLKAGPREP
jgi:hypothetical protein